MGGTSRTRPSTALARQGRTILSKRQLEIQLSNLVILRDKPNLRLEQYPVSAEVGADILYMAGFEHADIASRSVLDLGTGTGRLAIGAALMGAKKVVGVDIDQNSIKLATENSVLAGIRVEWRVGDVSSVTDSFDTVVMNPPYGTRVEHADTVFLECAFRLAPVVYSIHKSTTRGFIRDYVERHGRKVDRLRTVQMALPHLFSFHRRRWLKISVDLFRITN